MGARPGRGAPADLGACRGAAAGEKLFPAQWPPLRAARIATDPGGGCGGTALAAEQSTVERIVFDDASRPRKVLRHRVLHQLLPALRDGVPIERGPDGPARGRSIVIVEHASGAGAAAGIEMLHGIRKTAGVAHDGNGAVALAVHLIQSAGLIA